MRPKAPLVRLTDPPLRRRRIDGPSASLGKLVPAPLIDLGRSRARPRSAVAISR